MICYRLFPRCTAAEFRLEHNLQCTHPIIEDVSFEAVGSKEENQPQTNSDRSSRTIETAPAKGTGVWLIVVAAVLWSSSGFFTQTTLLDVWPIEHRGTAIAVWRALFSTLFLLPLVRKPSFHWVMIPMTLCFSGMTWTFLTALVSGSPANTIWLQYLAPAWVTLASIFLFREIPRGRDWFMLGTCILGVCFILVMDAMYSVPSKHYQWWAPLLAVMSGVCYAGVILCMRVLRDHESSWLAALNHIVILVLMAPMVWLSGVAIPSGWMWVILACLGILQMGLPYYLFARGLKSTPSHVASVITLLEPILLPVWVHFMRHGDPAYQVPQWWTWVGAGLILVGLTVRNVIRDEELQAEAAKA